MLIFHHKFVRLFDLLFQARLRHFPVLCAWLVITSTVAGTEPAQAQQSTPPAAAGDSTRAAVAIRAERAPVIDGKDDDAVWRAAPAVSSFREHDPVVVLRSARIEFDTASDALRRQVRRVLAAGIGDLWLQRSRVQAERGGALGVPAWFDGVPCMDAASVGLQRLARHARLDGDVSGSVQTETGQYVPDQD